MIDADKSDDRLGITDSVTSRLGKLTRKPPFVGRRNRRRHPTEKVGITGFVVVRLFGPDGQLKQVEQGANLVTDYGDEHIAKRMFDDAFDIVTGMRLGTGATAAAKAGAGAAIVTYIAASQEALDGVPVAVDLGAGLGYRTPHICTWIAGDVTNAAIAEVALTDETPITDVAGVVGDTVARFVFASTIDKQADDSLAVTWNVDFLGA